MDWGRSYSIRATTSRRTRHASASLILSSHQQQGTRAEGTFVASALLPPLGCPVRCASPPTHIFDMFAVDEATIEAISRALDEGGELSAIVELRRHFPLIADNFQERLCVRAIASSQPVPAPNKGVRDPVRY